MTVAAPISTMTSKQRWLAALRHEPMDYLPFWPKFSASYPPAQAMPFRQMTVPQIHAWVDSDPQRSAGPICRQIFRRCSTSTTGDNQRRRTVFSTPGHEMVRITEFDADSRAWHPVEFPVKTREDILRMAEWYDDARHELDPRLLEKSRAAAAAIGQSAFVDAGMGESALMHWVEWLAGVENAHLLLADYPDETQQLFEAIHRHLLQRMDIILEHHPADGLYMIENTSTTLISVEQYRRYNFPHLMEYARRAKRAGRILILHMCGHLKLILDDLAKLPVAGFEAFTAPTLGSATLLDGRRACPDKCLIGGTHAMLWLEPPEKIIAQIEAWLDELPHHRGLIVTSAGVMTPRCPPETIRQVRDWLKTYPARF